ncbi:MAG: galactokinase, partial [Fimbriimonadaceae bacterium]
MIVDEATSLFLERYGERPTFWALAPGRINLIGEHTDYNDGFVCPAAIDRYVCVAGRVVDGPTTLYSSTVGPAQTFHAQRVIQGILEGWAQYPAGVAWALAQIGFDDIPNVNAVVVSDLPLGAGVSSSAAIEMAFATLWNDLGRLALSPEELAKISQTAENRYVGVNCGIMDQFASALGRRSHALFLDTRSLEYSYAPIPEDLQLVVCNTNTPRHLNESEYNDRRMQCEEAADKLGVRTLRDISRQELHARQSDLDDLHFRRARHVVSENERCRDFVAVLDAGDLHELGRLMRESHESLRDDYEVSCPELDAMAEACWDAPGVVGARMTGAGFGGACVALVRRAEVDAFVDYVAPRS